MLHQQITHISPNSKCSGCYHYNSQLGPDGACTIGLRPATCGSGAYPSTGYNPIVVSPPTIAGDHAEGAHPSVAGGNPETIVPMRTVSLGEEHVPMIKSVVARLVDHERSNCRRHVMLKGEQRGGSCVDVPQANTGLAQMPSCSCRLVTDSMVAKSARTQMSNAMRVHVSDAELLSFIAKVRA